MEPVAPRRALDPTRGLLLLALVNVVAFVAWSWITTTFYAAYLALPLPLMATQNAIRQSQWQSYGIAAALVPQRRFVGLAWAIALGLVNGLIYVASLEVISISRGGVPLPADQFLLRMAVPAYEIVGVFALMQLMRFGLGWRLVAERQPNRFQRGQFRIGDLLEWTASIAVWLGINQFINIETANLFSYLSALLGTALILIPMAMATTSRHGLTGRTVFLLIAWIVAVELLFNALSYALDPAAFAWPWWSLLGVNFAYSAGWFLCTVVNFGIIRRLGYRWRMVGKQPVTTEALA
jgi:hypothetical protein